MSVNHIRHTHEEKKGRAWCGAPVTSFYWLFQNLDHAAYASLANGTIVPCRRCVLEAKKALANWFDETLEEYKRERECPRCFLIVVDDEKCYCSEE